MPVAAWVILWQLAAAVSQAPLASETVETPQPPASRVAQPPVPFDATRFDSLTATTLRGLFEDAAEMGLPVRPLVNRALEGSARRASSERILRVVREFAAALYEARQLLGPGSTEGELDAAATALRAGVDERTLGAIRDMRPAGTAVTALVVVTDLVQRGVPAPQAREALTAVGRSRPDDVLLGLQATVAKNASRGPGMAMDALQRYVRSNGTPGSSAGTPAPTPATPDRKPARPPGQ